VPVVIQNRGEESSLVQSWTKGGSIIGRKRSVNVQWGRGKRINRSTCRIKNSPYLKKAGTKQENEANKSGANAQQVEQLPKKHAKAEKLGNRNWVHKKSCVEEVGAK